MNDHQIWSTAIDLFEAIRLGKPPGLAVIVDYGIITPEHYETLYKLVRAKEISLMQLNEAVGDGQKLTHLVNSAPSNPHRGIVFKTVFDCFSDEIDRHDRDEPRREGKEM